MNNACYISFKITLSLNLTNSWICYNFIIRLREKRATCLVYLLTRCASKVNILLQSWSEDFTLHTKQRKRYVPGNKLRQSIFNNFRKAIITKQELQKFNARASDQFTLCSRADTTHFLNEMSLFKPTRLDVVLFLGPCFYMLLEANRRNHFYFVSIWGNEKYILQMWCTIYKETLIYIFFNFLFSNVNKYF